jgi:hypothetical protein
MRLNFFTPPGIPQVLPEDLLAEIDTLSKLGTKQQVLDAAYTLLTQKYRGYRIKTLTRLPDLFDVDINHMWGKEGFLHCTNLNYLLKIMLIRSGKFTKKDIKFVWTLIYFWSPHEYVRVQLDQDQWVGVDIWAKAYGITFGDHARGLHSGTRTSIQ